MPDDTTLMPEEQDEAAEPRAFALSSAVVQQIQDDIDDSRTLRSWRKGIATGLILISLCLFAAMLTAIGFILFDVDVASRANEAPTITVAIIMVLAAVPTLITISVARAVFGRKHASESPYAPLQALINVVKEMRGS